MTIKIDPKTEERLRERAEAAGLSIAAYIERLVNAARSAEDELETADFSRRVLSSATERLHVLSLEDVGWDDLGDPGRVNAIRYQVRLRKPVCRSLAPEAASVAAAG